MRALLLFLCACGTSAAATDASTDGPVEAGCTSGACGAPDAGAMSFAYHWDFECATIMLAPGCSYGVGGTCGTNLRIQSGSAQTLDFANQSTWKQMSSVLVRFLVKLDGGGAGHVLDRASSVPGGWGFTVNSQNQITFSINGVGVATSNALSPGAWHEVWGIYSGMTFEIVVDGTVTMSSVQGPSMGIAGPLTAGQIPGPGFSIDEIYVGGQ